MEFNDTTICLIFCYLLHFSLVKKVLKNGWKFSFKLIENSSIDTYLMVCLIQIEKL